MYIMLLHTVHIYVVYQISLLRNDIKKNKSYFQTTVCTFGMAKDNFLCIFNFDKFAQNKTQYFTITFLSTDPFLY